MSWIAARCIARGTSHIKTGTECQDFGTHCCIVAPSEVLIGVVADGAGSKQHSKTGAELVTKLTIQGILERCIDREGFRVRDEQEAQNFFKELLSKIIDQLNQYAERENYSVDELACTLLAFVATKESLVAAQIGDGFIIIRFEDDDDYNLVFKGHKGG